MKKILKKLIILFPLVFCACSIKYENSVEVSDVVPEFIFENSIITRYENKKLQVKVEAERMEDYKGSDDKYAKGVNFVSYDENKKVTTEGQCGLLYADTNKKIYELYDNIELNSISEKTKFYANELKFDEETEQLVSRKTDPVKIEKEDMVIYGSGFSASGVSKSFTFNSSVDGDIQTK